MLPAHEVLKIILARTEESLDARISCLATLMPGQGEKEGGLTPRAASPLAFAALEYFALENKSPLDAVGAALGDVRAFPLETVLRALVPACDPKLDYDAPECVCADLWSLVSERTGGDVNKAIEVLTDAIVSGQARTMKVSPGGLPDCRELATLEYMKGVFHAIFEETGRQETARRFPPGGASDPEPTFI